MKACKNCGLVKPLDDFHNHKQTKDGKRAKCKVCVREENKAWQEANPERYRAAIEAWWKAHPEKLKAKSVQQIARRRASGYTTRYYQENKEKVTEYSKRHYQEHKDLRAEQNAKWQAENVDRMKEYSAEWKRLNLDKIREYNHRRRAMRVAAGDDYSAEEATAILEAQRHICANDICGADLTRVKKHLDHKTPLVRGGGNGANNLQWLCQKCNLSKGRRTNEEWHEKLQIVSSGAVAA